MKEIYLDIEQCGKFNVEYFDGDRRYLQANQILSSKYNGYDEAHSSFLCSRGSEWILLERERADAPGWYRVCRTNESR